MGLSVDMHRQIETSGQWTNPSDMVVVFVCDKDAIEIITRQTKRSKSTFSFFAGQASINQ
jgi:hypothetical protein